MSRIVLDLKINGIDVSNHEFVLKINGCTVNNEPYDAPVIPLRWQESFISFIQDEIQRFLSINRPRSAEIHKSVLHQFKQYREEADLAFDDVTADVIKQFETYLQSRNLSLNTISFNMRVLRSCYNRGIHKFHLTDRQPFKHVFTGIEKTDKRALDIETIKAIKRAEPANQDERFARDMFMFSFFTRGMSFVDMAYLKRDNIRNGCLYYRRHKTGQSIAVKWEKCMQEIVDRYSESGSNYLLPIIHTANGKERNQYRGIQNKVNRSLKNVAAQCGLDVNLTMYVARHSWAHAADSLNQPLELISYGMGHASTKTTQIYLHFISMSQIDQLNTTVLQEVEAL